MIMFIDVFKVGWGCVINSIKIGGFWIQEESNYYINYLEMLVVYFGFKVYKFFVFKMYVKVLVDNIIVQNIFNKMGISYFLFLNSFIKIIWDWCIINEVWIIVVCIFGKENVDVDREF